MSGRRLRRALALVGAFALLAPAAALGAGAGPATAIAVTACSLFLAWSQTQPCEVTAQLVNAQGAPVAEAGVPIAFAIVGEQTNDIGRAAITARATTDASGAAQATLSYPIESVMSGVVVAQSPGLATGFTPPILSNASPPPRPALTLVDVQPKSPYQGSTTEAAAGDAVEGIFDVFGGFSGSPNQLVITASPASALRVTSDLTAPLGLPGAWVMTAGEVLEYQATFWGTVTAPGTLYVNVADLADVAAGEGEASMAVVAAPQPARYALVGADGLAITPAHPLAVAASQVGQPIALHVALVNAAGQAMAEAAPARLALDAGGSGAGLAMPGGPYLSSLPFALNATAGTVTFRATRAGLFVPSAMPTAADLSASSTVVRAPEAVDQGATLLVTVRPQDANGVPVPLAPAAHVVVTPQGGSAVTRGSPETAAATPAGTYVADFQAAGAGAAAVFRAALQGVGAPHALGTPVVVGVGHVAPPEVRAQTMSLAGQTGIQLRIQPGAGGQAPIGYRIYRVPTAFGSALPSGPPLMTVAANPDGPTTWLDTSDIPPGGPDVYGVVAVAADGALSSLSTARASFGPSIVAVRQPSPSELVLTWNTGYDQAYTGDVAVVTNGRVILPASWQGTSHNTTMTLRFPSAIPENAGTVLVMDQGGAVALFGDMYLPCPASVWSYAQGEWTRVGDGSQIPQYPAVALAFLAGGAP